MLHRNEHYKPAWPILKGLDYEVHVHVHALIDRHGILELPIQHGVGIIQKVP